jgi:hypothetical protein
MTAFVVLTHAQDASALRVARNLALQVHTMRLRCRHAEAGEAACAVRRVARHAVEMIAVAGERPLGRGQAIHRLLVAQSACDEARVQLDLLWRTGRLDAEDYHALHDGYLCLRLRLGRLAAEVRLRGVALTDSQEEHDLRLPDEPEGR